jgi:hypothetical protein
LLLEDRTTDDKPVPMRISTSGSVSARLSSPYSLFFLYTFVPHILAVEAQPMVVTLTNYSPIRSYGDWPFPLAGAIQERVLKRS